jgi:hypothetical protein
VDNLRTTDYNVFVRVNKDKAKVNNDAGIYNKMEEELQKLKLHVDKANAAKNMFNDLFADIK